MRQLALDALLVEEAKKNNLLDSYDGNYDDQSMTSSTSTIGIYQINTKPYAESSAGMSTDQLLMSQADSYLRESDMNDQHSSAPLG